MTKQLKINQNNPNFSGDINFNETLNFGHILKSNVNKNIGKYQNLQPLIKTK